MSSGFLGSFLADFGGFFADFTTADATVEEYGFTGIASAVGAILAAIYLIKKKLAAGLSKNTIASAPPLPQPYIAYTVGNDPINLPV